ncbi:hypothetical protein JMJ35_002369 [Cladonia borealis]|uniref:Ankyrin n=1 Tax=Cladonia borealis TaxID=184061 RepID=A0AA39R541_9LECA|nr:hypothetical protein JMJ35_002369 [Cladonia borealis]
MDPLSVSASVVALLGAGGTLAKLLRKGIGLKNAPDVLRVLNDEVSELQSTANDVNDLLWTADRDPDDHPPKSLVSSLSRVKSILLQLESYISYQLTTVTADGERNRLDKSVYLRAEHRLQEFKDEILTSRIALAADLSLFASSIGMRNQIQSRQISSSLELLHNKFEMVPVLDTPQEIAFPQTTSRPIGTRVKLLESPPVVASESENSQDRSGINPDAPSKPRNDDSQLVVSSELRKQTQHKSTSLVQLMQDYCDTSCHCPCHSINQIRSPKFLHAFLGSFFLRYRAYPSREKACGVRCRARADGITCVYSFPPLLLERAISIFYSCSLAKGPELLLRVMRRREFYTFAFLVSDDESYALKEMKRMLDCGEASVLDIDEDGWTILQLAVRLQKWEVGHMLISYGADINYVDQEEKYPISIFIDAWSKWWRRDTIQNDIAEKWDDLFFQDITQFDSFGFSSLHKAYLGLSGLTFDQVLASTKRSDVDKSDDQGRTVLSWAAARGDSQTVGKLLACGADPDKKRTNNRSPLHFALGADVSTAEMLLDAKADVNLTDDGDRIPMHYVTSGTSSLIKRMVDLGADIGKRSVHGRTPLSLACRYGHAYAVKELLDCGADINDRDGNGLAPIAWALRYNHNHTISILLSSPSLRFEADDGNKSNFFSDVAIHCDVQTLVTLKDQWPIRTGFEETFNVDEALDYARHRRDFNGSWSKDIGRPRDEDPIAWHEAFTEMINTIIERSRQASDSEDEIWKDAREQPEDPSLAPNATISA